MLTCSRCRVIKPETEFYKYGKGSLGYRSTCKPCYLKEDKISKVKHRDKRLEYFKQRNLLRRVSLIDFVYRMYTGMKERVAGNKSRFGSYQGKPICSRREFMIFAFTSWQLKELYSNWKNNNYEHFLTPTPDRIDNSKGYTLDNIQFLTFIDNTRKR